MNSKVRARPTYQPSIVVQLASGLSFISALVTAGILSYFVDALRRDAMPVPWPIVLIMSASCVNITSLIAASLIRCCFPASPLLQLFFHAPVSILWICTIAFLGDELGNHLTQSCPSVNTFGHNMAIVCQLFKALFSFAVISTASSIFLSTADIAAWKRMKKAGKYTAMEKNTGAVSTPAPFKNKPRRKVGIMNGLFKRKGGDMPEDEASFMMSQMHSESMEKSRMTGSESALSAGDRMAPPRISPEWGPRQGVGLDKNGDEFGTQDTRYDPGSRIF
ncbi:hypothetical protein K491DRAFT_674060 [Lophiostoma macrostomum CBS 122681]|uniref:MARVEL domain-containing protein n=1 Tax=Lophiostoma macrostomum CBS 122681 TaxID=1314788 RepID=A0A6A6TNM7_9PLEO|nr:hypothetical protein K491DRAFT_674060 [Lophiostoma macrostomum CBS 122681]